MGKITVDELDWTTGSDGQEEASYEYDEENIITILRKPQDGIWLYLWAAHKKGCVFEKAGMNQFLNGYASIIAASNIQSKTFWGRFYASHKSAILLTTGFYIGMAVARLM